jgi:hypothetical protein
MQVEMVHDFLIPGMENSNEPKLALKPPLRITSEHLKCFFDSRKQHREHNPLICKNKRIQFMRQGEYIMKVRTWQEFCLPGTQPFFFYKRLALRAVSIPTRVVGILFKAAVVTGFYVSTKHCCPARFYVVHGFRLFRR